MPLKHKLRRLVVGLFMYVSSCASPNSVRLNVS